MGVLKGNGRVLLPGGEDCSAARDNGMKWGKVKAETQELLYQFRRKRTVA